MPDPSPSAVAPRRARRARRLASGSATYGQSKTGVLSASVARSKAGFRPDIQAIRAFAVLAVIANHVWPTAVPGGYVGVDIFFVISGFLITSHLGKELEGSNRIKLARFYARRIRRLLPAAFLVIFISMLAMLLLMPVEFWEKNALAGLAATLYGENILLWNQAVDYHAGFSSASLFQHYWSLSVEEQFYLVWPLLLLIGVRLHLQVRRWRAQKTGRKRQSRRRVIDWRRSGITVIALASLVSFICAIAIGSSDPARTYFFTPYRAWEFGAGALIAAGSLHLRYWGSFLPRWAWSVINLAGWICMFISLWLVDASAVFPGWWTLLPVAGASCVILTGMIRGDTLERTGKVHGIEKIGQIFTHQSAVQYLGDISYSLYLWHWPLLLLAPFALKKNPDFPEQILVLLIVLILAGLTHLFVENKGIKFSWWVKSSPKTFAAMVAGMAAVLALCVPVQAYTPAYIAAQLKNVKVPGQCDNPLLNSGEECASTRTPVQTAQMGEANQYWVEDPPCTPIIEEDGARRIIYRHCESTAEGNPGSGERGQLNDPGLSLKKVLLIGDSHAQQYSDAVIAWARSNRMDLYVYYSGGCPLLEANIVGYGDKRFTGPQTSCTLAAKELTKQIETLKPDLILYASNVTESSIEDGSGDSQQQQFIRAYETRFKQFLSLGSKVVVIGDTPRNEHSISGSQTRTPGCLSLNLNDPEACALPRKEVVSPDPALLAVAAMQQQNPALKEQIRSMEVTDLMCDDEKCYAAIGGTPVYYDAGHINKLFLKQIAGTFGQRLNEQIAQLR